MKNQEPSKLSAVRKLISFLTLLFATFCFIPGQSQVVKITKIITITGINGDSITTTSVTSTDSMKMNIGKNMSGNQASNVLDSISITDDKVIEVTPDVVKLLGSMMNEMMQGMTTQFNGMQLTPSGRLINDSLLGNSSSTTSAITGESEPDPVPVYVNPYCKLSDELFEWSKEPFGKERLVSIERKSSETVVTLSIPIYLNQWIRFSNKFQLINKKNGDRFNIRRVENMPLNTEIFFHDVAGRMVLAKVIFPPLKHNVKIVDIIEFSDTNEYESEWSFKDIKIADYKPDADKISSGRGAKVYY